MASGVTDLAEALEYFQNAVDTFYSRNVEYDEQEQADDPKAELLQKKKLTPESVFSKRNLPCLNRKDAQALREKNEIFRIFLDNICSHGNEYGETEVWQNLMDSINGIHRRLFAVSADTKETPSLPTKTEVYFANDALAYYHGEIPRWDPVLKDTEYSDEVKLKGKEKSQYLARRALHRYLPITVWIWEVTLRSFIKDIIAGTTVACTLIPQSLAYATLANLPPVYGLYAGFIPQFVYVFLGTSRQAALGPVAVLSLIVGNAVTGVDCVNEPNKAVAVALTIALGAGVVSLVLGILHMGWLVRLLSYPVLIGFMMGAGVSIAISQSKDLFGIKVPQDINNGPPYASFGYQLTHLGETKWQTFLFGFISIFVLVVTKQINRRFKLLIPGPLIIIIFGTLASSQLQLNQKTQLSVVGTIPSGTPPFGVPNTSVLPASQLIGTIFSVAFIGYLEQISISKTYARRFGYKIDSSQELIAMGASNLIGSFCGAYPICVSFSRTAINAAAGATSNITKVVSALWVLLAMLVIGKILYWLPKACLSAIIIVAIADLIDYGAAYRIFKIRKLDVLSIFGTFLFVFFLGVEIGAGCGIAMSFGVVVIRQFWPRLVLLGRLAGVNVYKDTSYNPTLIQTDRLLIIQWQCPLYFFNVDLFKMRLRKIIRSQIKEKKGMPIQCVILDMSTITDIDVDGLENIQRLVEELKNQGIVVLVAGVLQNVLNLMDKLHLRLLIGVGNFFTDVASAVDHATLGTTDGSRSVGYDEVSRIGSTYLLQFQEKEVPLHEIRTEPVSFAEGGGI